MNRIQLQVTIYILLWIILKAFESSQSFRLLCFYAKLKFYMFFVMLDFDRTKLYNIRMNNIDGRQILYYGRFLLEIKSEILQ